MHRSIRLLAAASVVAAAAVTLTPQADAATSSLQFRTFVADQPGADLPLSQYKLNREYITVKNTSTRSVKVGGYRIRDKANHTFVFPSGYTIRAGSSVRVHTGRGTNTSTDVYWKQGYYVWNNTGDTAYLSTPGGTRLDVCTYYKNSSGRKYC
ncbi:lamin tail domain-containing protein [Luteipulveratus sp. YIM 133132]|uniref:lamin tail domain-containing protein n=1 Tax=Luteipulveratus flavus TaxID=3031728 RepID=UPI0023AFDACC|nr:lamin tail domain-containing protein [Luteipulveratus sp. YIM 133132]MDE9364369.1 lamin tail domain-containing protein [Luteipulveratus sp. YIM 133132]